MTPALCLTIYCLIVIGSSLLGGWIPSLLRLTHLRMQLILSGVGGLMLGIGLLHLLPHSVVETGSLDVSMVWVLAGLLVTFFLIRVFHFHSHAAVPTGLAGVVAGVEVCSPECDHLPAVVEHHSASHASHASADSVVRPSPAQVLPAPEARAPVLVGHGHSSRLSWLAVVFGMSLHTLIDGLALAAAVLAESQHADRRLWGFGVFLAIVLHKPLDALSVTSVMQAGGWSLAARQSVNFAFSLMCPIGAAVVWLGVGPTDRAAAWWLGACLAFAAGSFLCISLSDLLPELQFHHHDRIPLSIALLGGVLLALLIGLFEPSDAHGHHGHSCRPGRPGEQPPSAVEVRVVG